ncbi:MAG: phosphate signaling complex protein PhoU [Ruminococcus sp.]|nr:phosphate signaling complex protein PhoU [Oscillospiraceae bacterium]
MRNRFDSQLETLNNKMIEMGSMCEEIIALVAKALSTGDPTYSERISSLENDIDHMERDIESLCLRLLLQQQPVAKDLRQISAALKMITDMERIGDQAADISEFIRYLDERAKDDCKYIYLMAEASIKMVSDSVEAFVKKDLSLARSAIAYDDIIDDYFRKVKAAIIGLIEQKSGSGEYLLDLLMVGKYFERIGDHAVNIAEWVVFSVTGVHKGD